MSRYSPQVLPQPFNLGGILEQIIQGYEGGRQVKRGRKREEREDTLFRQDQEDRSTALRDRRAEQLSRPGARTLADHLGDRSNYDFENPDASGGPITEESLRRIGDAGDEGATIDFRQPDPTPVLTRGGPSVNIGGVQMPVPQMMEEQAPFVTGQGVVMDPRRARQQTTLGKELARYENLEGLRDELELRNEINPPAWEPKTAEERLGYQEDLARRTGLLGQRERSTAGAGRAPTMPLGITAIQKQIDDTQQDLTVRARLLREPDRFMPDPLEVEFYEVQLRAIDQLQQRLDSLTAKRDSMVTTIQSGIVDGLVDRTPTDPSAPADRGPSRFILKQDPLAVPGAGATTGSPLPPARAPSPAVPEPPAAGGATVPSQGELTARARKLRADNPKWTVEQIAEELRRQDQGTP